MIVMPWDEGITNALIYDLMAPYRKANNLCRSSQDPRHSAYDKLTRALIFGLLFIRNIGETSYCSYAWPAQCFRYWSLYSYTL